MSVREHAVMDSPLSLRLDRRRLLKGGLAAAGAIVVGPGLTGAAARAGAAPFAVLRTGRPQITHGVQSGDLSGSRALVWARADRPARMEVAWSTTYTFDDAQRLAPVTVTPASDFTAKVDLAGLPRGQQVFYKVTFADLDDPSLVSEPEIGSFRTPPRAGRDVSFAFTGDCAGQGWGINEEWGGMRCWETMRQSQPDLFIHSGDSIYADGIIEAEVKLPDGTTWKNLTTPEKSKVAETLDEFRGNYRYNLLDANVRRFLTEVPVIAQWDDHEVVNNWYPGEVIDYRASLYRNETRIDVLAARARQAFLEYMPIRPAGDEDGRVYRKISYGPLLDVFVVDMRSYRAPNSANVQPSSGPDTAFLGDRQLTWLKTGIDESDATWKVIAADMPIGLVVADYADGNNPHEPGPAGHRWFEAIANAEPGVPKGRELEIADLLFFLKRRQIRNVVWVTADVHYAAAHYYNPEKAAFADFDGFWEFVAGPVNAGTFGPNDLDATFGPELRFVKAPPAGQVNLAPSAGLQFFGLGHICGQSGVLTVSLIDVAGTTLFSVDLEPDRR